MPVRWKYLIKCPIPCFHRSPNISLLTVWTTMKEEKNFFFDWSYCLSRFPISLRTKANGEWTSDDDSLTPRHPHLKSHHTFESEEFFLCECVKKGNEYTFEVDHAEETFFLRYSSNTTGHSHLRHHHVYTLCCCLFSPHQQHFQYWLFISSFIHSTLDKKEAKRSWVSSEWKLRCRRCENTQRRAPCSARKTQSIAKEPSRSYLKINYKPWTSARWHSSKHISRLTCHRR